MLEHVLKIFEIIILVQVMEKVNIDNIQLGFMEGKGTTHAIFIVRSLQEKYIAKKKYFGWHSLISRKHLTEYLVRWSGGR